MNIGLFLPNWIGDAVMATPALRALRTRYPEARLTGIARPIVAELLSGTPWLDEMLLYDPRAARRELRQWALIQAMRQRRFDLLVLLPNSHRTALLGWLSGARRRVGFARRGRRWLLHEAVEPLMQAGRRVPRSALDDYLELAYAAGCQPESPQVELATSADDEAQAAAVWAEYSWSDDEPIVALNTGGAFGPAKQWPLEYFAVLARRIAREQRRRVLVLCGPAERQAARQIVAEAADPSVVSLAETRLSIGLTKACVRRAELLVTTDSGPRHFAAAFETPVITLFGPTHIAWSENHYARATHLQLALECQPCQQRECPLGHHRCMKELSVEQVYAAVVAQLATAAQQVAADHVAPLARPHSGAA